MALDARSASRRDSLPRGGDSGEAQGRLRPRNDAGNGESSGGDAWRRSGSDRHDVFDGRGGPAHVWRYDAFRVAEQVRDVRSRTRRSGRSDYAVEFSDGDSLLEDNAGADLREHDGAET